MASRNYKSQQQTTEEELSKRLMLTLLGIVGIIVFCFLAVFVFAPTVGAFFGLFSKYRNQQETTITARLNPPIFNNMPDAVKETTMSINGYAQPGVKVRIYVNGPQAGETVAAADGGFTFTNLNLNQGKNTIFGKAIDSTGTESDKTDNYSVTVDNTKPKLEITSPKDKDTVSNLDKRIIVTGKVDKKSTITVNGKMAILKPDLTFEFLLGVDEGDVTIKVEATDTAGNVSDQSIKVKYQKQSN